ncbi:glycosyltransferase family 1 protein [Brevundimonas sp.]|uniref:glycosyltransferase family 4 protein n=1 Tax=Brevundimonas sp. TaxID=1871086 RepID=UPI0028ADC8EA|nr:glycosyltransferase family 1 protein [Brevundimonas sp.]
MTPPQTSPATLGAPHGRLCIDGYNIGLSKGTGIATYGRNLLANARALGFSPSLLAGPVTRGHGGDFADESAIAGCETVRRKWGKGELFARTMISRFGQSAYPVKPTGQVVWRDQNRPDVDNYWMSPSLYRLASRAFVHYGAETPVTFRGTDEIPVPTVVHWTATLPVRAVGIANVYTIHDLIPLKLPHLTTDDPGRYMQMCKMIVRNADQIAVVSETTRRDVIELLGVEEDRVMNTYQAITLPDEIMNRPQDEILAELEGIFGLDWKGYMLHFGAIEPKKNLGRIIEAYLASGAACPLIIVGGAAWMSEDESALLDGIRRNGGAEAERVRQYEYLPFPLLMTLIRGARATLFPSLYEGFGLPVLESMALGTAVLTSTAGSLPEIAGGAALLVDPYDTCTIARAIRSLDQDQDLATELAARGQERAMVFNPKAYQKRLQELYGRLGL